MYVRWFWVLTVAVNESVSVLLLSPHFGEVIVLMVEPENVTTLIPAQISLVTFVVIRTDGNVTPLPFFHVIMWKVPALATVPAASAPSDLQEAVMPNTAV